MMGAMTDVAAASITNASITDASIATAPAVTEPILETTDESDPARCAHIVDGGGAGAEAIILEARINGLPVVALCGYTWVPHRDPTKLPVCQECLRIARERGLIR
jgi:hypothetical protein